MWEPVSHDGTDSRCGSAEQIIMLVATIFYDLLIKTVRIRWFIVFSLHKFIKVEALIVVAAVVIVVVVVQVVHSTWFVVFIITHGVVG
jgi:hypothetical protein